MTGMPQIQSIRRMGRNGESMASIARKQHVSGPTVRKYLRMDDLSEKPPVRKRRGSVVDPYPPLIERWLAEDRGSWRKQRHTATRIWEWLRDEHCFASMFVRQVRQCFSAVWADGFPRCRHRFPVM